MGEGMRMLNRTPRETIIPGLHIPGAAEAGNRKNPGTASLIDKDLHQSSEWWPESLLVTSWGANSVGLPFVLAIHYGILLPASYG